MASKVVLDANVLYSARLRDLFMELAVSGLVDIVWTKHIEEEWMAAILRERPGLSRQLRRTALQMRRTLPEAQVEVDEEDRPSVALPDPNDMHILAAALASNAGAIVTFNVDDFPASALDRLEIEALTPDQQLLRLATADPEGVVAAAATMRARLRTPPVAASAYAAGFARTGCPRFAAWLAARLDHL
jgi:predicted nucleic acid-binding protein